MGHFNCIYAPQRRTSAVSNLNGADLNHGIEKTDSAPLHFTNSVGLADYCRPHS
jgi:hypothetical protein